MTDFTEADVEAGRQRLLVVAETLPVEYPEATVRDLFTYVLPAIRDRWRQELIAEMGDDLRYIYAVELLRSGGDQ